MNHTMPKHVKAGTVNAIRNAADKRLAAEFAQRRIELAAKLDAIFAANKAARDGALQPLQGGPAIDYGAELAELQDDMADREYHASGAW